MMLCGEDKRKVAKILTAQFDYESALAKLMVPEVVSAPGDIRELTLDKAEPRN